MTLILGRKRGMTQVFQEDGSAVGVTVVAAGPCVVSQVRSQETDGYDAIQLGFEDATDKAIKRAYRKLSLKYHPDKNTGASPERARATAMFQRVGEAYETLKDQTNRRVYDRDRRMGTYRR